MSSSAQRTGSGSGATIAAFTLGMPAGVGVLWATLYGPFQNETLIRYLHHPIEQAEVVLFFAAVAALITKMLGTFRQRAALDAEILPAWDGKAVSPQEAVVLLRKHEETLNAWRATWFGRRCRAVLEFVKSRGSANDLDDHLRTLSDADAMALEASYSLVRFITWAIPILGFLGTVVGITDAITGITPDKLENNIGDLVGGLSLAFDSTALGLGLTMVVMFVSFLIERAEQSALEGVDAAAESELGHRFQRLAADQTSLISAVESSSQRMFDTGESLVRRQSELWSQSLEKITTLGRDAAKEQHGKLVTGLGLALQDSLTKHAQRLAEIESQMLARQDKMLAAMTQIVDVLHATSQKHHQGLTDVGQRLAQQTAALVQLQQGGAELTRLQETLAQNLSALAGTGAFEEAVQSLTAAIHLLTTRVAPPPKKAA